MRNGFNVEVLGIGDRKVRQHHAVALIDNSDPANNRHIIGSISSKPYDTEQLRALTIKANNAGFGQLVPEVLTTNQRIERLDPSLENISSTARHLRVLVEIHECAE